MYELRMAKNQQQKITAVSHNSVSYLLNLLLGATINAPSGSHQHPCIQAMPMQQQCIEIDAFDVTVYISTGTSINARMHECIPFIQQYSFVPFFHLQMVITLLNSQHT